MKCDGPHEYFSCGSACDNVCSLLHIQSQANCPIINIDCNRMCYCEEGYARDENNICIPIEDCEGARIVHYLLLIVTHDYQYSFTWHITFMQLIIILPKSA